jgi:lysyl-tRNA synthetase class 2
LISPVLLETLPRRAEVLRSIRMTLDEAGFTEVETPIRIPAPANEPHINPPQSGNAFLRASPELQMKRLISLGLERIYQIGACFRTNERGDRHNPEFTMLEWYRSNSDYRMLIGDIKKIIVDAACNVCGSTTIVFDGREIDLSMSWEIITVRDAFKQFAGWDPLENFDAERFHFDMAMKVEPALPKDHPCILMDYPHQEASLARLSEEDERVAERWEAYIGGMELCNAFSELVDTETQRIRFEEARAEKIRLNETPMPIDENFMSALGAMPPSAGAALGVDRLAMLLLDKQDIASVRPFCQLIGNLY